MTNHCREQATDVMLNLCGPAAAFKYWRNIQGLNDAVLWKLTSAVRFRSRWVMQVPCVAQDLGIEAVSKSRSWQWFWLVGTPGPREGSVGFPTEAVVITRGK